MTIAVRLVLFLFLVFLSTPTIVSVIRKSCETSSSCNSFEEELAQKDIKADFRFDHSYEFVNFTVCTLSAVVSTCQLMHDEVSVKILIPPPELFNVIA